MTEIGHEESESQPEAGVPGLSAALPEELRHRESPQGLPGCRFAPTHSPALKTHFLSLAPLVENCLGETLPHAKLWAQSESGSHRHGESDLSCQGSAQDVATLPFAVAADTTLLLRPRLVGWGRWWATFSSILIPAGL